LGNWVWECSHEVGSSEPEITVQGNTFSCTESFYHI
jgi:hypothetical protein